MMNPNWKIITTEKINEVKKERHMRGCFTSKRPQGDWCEMGLQGQEECKWRIEKYKARPVAKAYSQRVAINYDKVFASAAQLKILRLIISLAAQNIGESIGCEISFLMEYLRKKSTLSNLKAIKFREKKKSY